MEQADSKLLAHDHHGGGGGKKQGLSLQDPLAEPVDDYDDAGGPLLDPSSRASEQKKVAVSPLVCSFFLLNMLLGSGPLTLPYAFSQAGLVLGSIFVVVGAFIAYMSATFLIECLAGSNAIRKKQSDPDLQVLPGSTASDKLFDIDEKIEVGQMAGMYFTPAQTKLVYAMLVLYLYGTLCVYALTSSPPLINYCRQPS